MGNFISGLSASLLETLPLIPAAIGFYVALRALRFPDLTVEGSFVFGSVISAIVIQNNFNSIYILPLSIIGGMLCGLLTGLWNSKLKIPAFASGIITTFIMSFVNYAILKKFSYNNGQIVSLNLNNGGIVEIFKKIDFKNKDWGQYNIAQIIFIISIILITIVIVWLILRSKIGLQIRAFGSDRTAGKIYKSNYYFSVLFGLAFTNGLVSLSGAIVSQVNTNVDLIKGASLLVPLLAAVVFGEFFMVFVYEKSKIRKNKVVKPILSRPFSMAVAPSLGFLIYNMIVLMFSVIIVPFYELESYHKYWIIALFMIIVLAIKKMDSKEQLKDDLI